MGIPTYLSALENFYHTDNQTNKMKIVFIFACLAFAFAVAEELFLDDGSGDMTCDDLRQECMDNKIGFFKCNFAFLQCLANKGKEKAKEYYTCWKQCRVTHLINCTYGSYSNKCWKAYMTCTKGCTFSNDQ